MQLTHHKHWDWVVYENHSSIFLNKIFPVTLYSNTKLQYDCFIFCKYYQSDYDIQ